MFDFLIDKVQDSIKSLRGQGRITEKNIQDSLKSIQMALLQADVHYSVVKALIENVKSKAVSEKVIDSITPTQQFIKIFNDELTNILGGEHRDLQLKKEQQNSIMLCGLQGSGKTTTAAKLAHFYKKQGYKVLLVPLDVYRPAAIEQLRILSKEVDVSFFEPPNKKPRKIAKSAMALAEKESYNLTIYDTAGRLHIDKDMMTEVKDLSKIISPTEVIYIADSMTGQDAVKTAQAFNEAVSVDGMILTKMDSDAKGGAALSIKYILNKPIFFITTGEKTDNLERFYGDRIASRILNMGDIVSLVEKAQSTMDEKKAKEYERKLMRAEFSFQDFLEQLKQIKAMGPLEDILKMLPGMGALKNLNVDEKQLTHIEAIISSMTFKEREQPNMINGSRRQRIAAGSGTSIQEVNNLLKQFDMMKKMMKKMKKGMNMFKGMPGLGAGFGM